MKIRSIWILLLLCINCNEADKKPDSEDTGVQETISADEIKLRWCKPLAERLCENIKDCGCDKIEDFPKNCVDNLYNSCSKKVNAIVENIKNLNLIFDFSAIEECLYIASQFGNACRKIDDNYFSTNCLIIYSKASLGESCTNTLCAKGEGICIDGKCKKLPNISEECISGLCSKGLTCNSNGICNQPLNEGKVCKTNDDCSINLICVDNKCSKPQYMTEYTKCYNPNECSPHLTCTATQERVCKSKPALYEKCNSDECQNGLYCDTEEGICKNLPSENEACTDLYLCKDGLGCNLETGICIKAPSKGEDCLMGHYGPFICGDDSVCIDGKCVEIPKEGEKCGMDSKARYICSEDLGCFFKDDGTNICQKRSPTGEPCTNDSNCYTTDYCDYTDMRCKNRFPINSPCNNGNECEIGLDCFSQEPGEGKRCYQLPALNEPCFSSCQSDLACLHKYGYGRCAPSICSTLIF